MAARCGVCAKAVRPRAENAAFPFCSEHCRLIDLGRWLDADYRIPGPPVALPEERLEGDDDGESGWPGSS